MESQNYSNHARFVKGYHYVLSLLLIIGLIVSLINLFRHMDDNRMAVSLMLPLLFVCGLFTFWYMREFALRAQDRAIRAEESLRYFILTGKAIDSRITMSQIIALRFAPDEEFLPLCDRAVTENLSSTEIKKAIKNWKADNNRA